MNACAQPPAEHVSQHDLAQLVSLISSVPYANAFRNVKQYRLALLEFIDHTAAAPSAARDGRGELLAWTTVTERIPDSERNLLLYCEAWNEPVWIGYFQDDCWYTADGESVTPTHWAEMPGGPL